MAKSINISQADFELIAGAAWEAKRRGDEAAAEGLDKIARKINAALSAQPYNPMVGNLARLSWKDVPSTLENFHAW